MIMNKNKLLRKSIILDLISMSTLFIPIAGTLIDLIWAPYAAKQMNDMYKGEKGKIVFIFVCLFLIVYAQLRIKGLSYYLLFSFLFSLSFYFPRFLSILVFR